MGRPRGLWNAGAPRRRSLGRRGGDAGAGLALERCLAVAAGAAIDTLARKRQSGQEQQHACERRHAAQQIQGGQGGCDGKRTATG